MKNNILRMKKGMHILFSILMLLLNTSGIHKAFAAAYHIDTVQAKKVAETFLRSKTQTKSGIILLNKQIHSPYKHLYFYGNEDCFVVVADHRAVHPILGYSNENSICGQEFPDNVHNWLKSYDEEIEYTLKNGIASTEVIDLEWNNLLNGKGLMPESKTTVKPLIQTRWSQRMPYNSLCPDVFGNGQHAVTGCVATAMAQVMNYWEHPVKGRGSHTDNEWGGFSANFGSTTYEWDLMKDDYSGQYSEQEANAIGTLMYHCGVSVDMDYGISASRAYFSSVENAMEQYFKYDTAMCYRKQWNYNGSNMLFSDEEWSALLKEELDLERPVLYCGGVLDCHAFICDGYDESGYFHFNWGWAGTYDGYFALGHLNPNNHSFYQANCIYLRCKPSQTTILPPNNVSAMATGREVSISWNNVEGAVSYKVYRDDHVIATCVTDTCYVDQEVDYGEHLYYLKSVSSNSTMSLKSEKKSVNIIFTGVSPTNLEAVQSGNSVSLSWDMPPKSKWLKYGDNSFGVAFGYDGGTYWAQHYTVSSLATYAGMMMDKVSVYIHSLGNYSLFIYKGNETTHEELIYQKDFTPSATGWTQVSITTPVILDYTKDLWIVFFSNANNPAASCFYDGPGCGIEGAALASGSLENGWFTVNEGERSWMIRIGCTRNDSFNVYRNGEIIASGLAENYFEDLYLEEGRYEYYVTDNYDSNESQPTNNVIVDIAVCPIIATSDIANSCTINGDGVYYRGQTCILTALPNYGYKFVNWTENDSVVSSSNTYSFIVNGPRSLIAHVKNNASIDEAHSQVLSVYPNPTNGQVIIEAEDLKHITISNMLGQVIYEGKVGGNAFEYNFGKHGAGLYLIRIRTSSGTVVKKISVAR